MKTSTVLSSIFVEDLGGSVDWYTKFLGRPHDRAPQESCREWEIVKNSYLQVVVNPKGPSSSSVALIVTDLDEERQALRERGIETDEVREYAGFVKTAAFNDPEGNVITLVQTLRA